MSHHTFPVEIIDKILNYQFDQIMANSTASINSNLQVFVRSNLTVSKQFQAVVERIIYRYCCIKTSKQFHSLLETIRMRPHLAEYIQVLDFQEFTSIGLGRTGQMNKEIQLLTATTISEFLQRTSLREFLACEHIQDDIDAEVLTLLFNMPKLDVLDFCGCSGPSFQLAFTGVEWPESTNIRKLSLHDCTDLSQETLVNILQRCPNLTKLDLYHTAVTGTVLMLGVSQVAQITHLNLSDCHQLSPRELLHFMLNHPAISNKLVWLNLAVQASRSNAGLSTQQLKFLIKLMKNLDLHYLNLGGLPCDFQLLMLIKEFFPSLESLTVKDSAIDLQHLTEFLQPPLISCRTSYTNLHQTMSHPAPTGFSGLTSSSSNPEVTPQFGGIDDVISSVTLEDVAIDTAEEPQYQQIKYLDVSNNTFINRYTIDNPHFLNASSALVALEFQQSIWQQLLKNVGGELTYNTTSGKSFSNLTPLASYYRGSSYFSLPQMKSQKIRWKLYDSNGRRGWLFKVDDVLNQDNLSKVGLTEYDTVTGRKKFKVIPQPDFLKFASKKVIVSDGILREADPVWGAKVERGMYRYYGLMA